MISLGSSTRTKASTQVEDGDYMQTGWNLKADFKIPKAFSCYLTKYQSEESSTSCNPYSKWLPLNTLP